MSAEEDRDTMDLAEVDRRARARLAAERGENRQVPAAKLFVVPALPSRGIRCPSCHELRAPAEFVADPSKCDGCRAAIERRNEKAVRELEARIERIPPVYRGDPSWTRERPPPFLSESAVRMGLEWLASKASRLSIFGEQTGSGKSTLAAFLACADAHDKRGWEWVHAKDLIPDHEVPERAKEAIRVVYSAPRVIVDGFGKEFRGHDPTGGWAARKKEWTHALIGHAHEAKNQRYIFTFDMGIERVPTLYDRDASFLRRVAPDDGKTVIVLSRPDKLRIAKGDR